VLDAGGLSTAQMQAIASEFNYSGTTFVLPPRDSAHDAQVRIFTVNNEIFLRLITLLDLLCFAMVLAHGGSSFAPDRTPESKKLADYYRTLKHRSIEAQPFRVV
jgi:hypothetical protein